VALLEVDRIDAFYGGFQALFETSLVVEKGEIVAVVGANGAGKSTLLRSISGLTKVASGEIRFAGRPIGSDRPERIAEQGLTMVPEGRRIFSSLSIEENLLMGAYVGRSGEWNLKRVYELFPVLGDRRRSPGMSLSGGQQQMLAIGRGLMANPVLLMLDEISLGLAPVAIKQLYTAVPALRDSGTSVLLVEQDVGQAMATADRTYCLLGGRVSLEARPGDVSRADLVAAYFGVNG
jgi:branched-chain amino acid transport system ATP-binding protein